LGAPAVLMFFVLSGYVIGLATTEPASAPGVRRYAVHRFARLVPLNVVAVLVSWLLLPDTNGRTILGNLLFLQNDQPLPLIGHVPVLANNGNLWSLNYEAVFYLGFIAIWLVRPSTVLVFSALAAVVAAHAIGLPVSALTARYACGALYWVAGLAVAWHTPPADDTARRTNWPAAMLGFYAVTQVGALRAVLMDLQAYGWLWTTLVSPHRIDILLASVWLLLAATGRAPRLRRTLTWSCLTLATAGLIAQSFGSEPSGRTYLVGIAVASAWWVAHRDFALTPLQRCAPLGLISFGLYVIASPLQIAQRAVWPDFSGSWLTFTARAAALTMFSLATAWLLERKFAARISRWIRGPKRRTPIISTSAPSADGARW
jgi:peptidoglycan/LPS O-acetylase OafA/YrhL